MDPDEDALSRKIDRAAEAVPALLDAYIKHEDEEAFDKIMLDLLGETYADLLALMIALAEHAAIKAELTPNPEPNSPDVTYTIRIFGRDGTLKDPNNEPPEVAWTARFLAGVWANDVEQVDALFHVFVTSMGAREQATAIRSVLRATAQIVNTATQEKEGDQ